MTRRGLVVLVCLLAGLLGGSGASTYAGLTDSAAVAGGAFSAGRIVTPNAPRVTLLLGSGTITWDATTVDTGAGSVAVAGYQVYRYAAASGGAGTLACSTTTQTTCNVSGQGLGTVYFAVRALFGTAWTAESSRTAAGDNTAPTITHKYPVNGTSAGSSPLSSKVTSDCGSGIACGAASDNVSVSTVTYQLQRATGALGLTLSCWNGSGWTAGACGLNTYLNATVTTTGGVTTWVVPGAPGTAYPNNTTAAFTLTVRATDPSTNTGTSTIRYNAT